VKLGRSSASPALVALALVAGAARADAPHPPFTLDAVARVGALEVRVAPTQPLAGTIGLRLAARGHTVAREIPARAGVVTLPLGDAAWRLEATWRDPLGRMGATAIVSAEAPVDPRPVFAPIPALRVGALQVEQAIVVPVAPARGAP